MMVPAASLVRKKNRVGFSNCAVTAVKVDTFQRLEPLSSIIVWCVLDEEKKNYKGEKKKKLSHGLRRNISLGRSLIINECIRRRNASKNKTKQKTGWPTLSRAKNKTSSKLHKSCCCFSLLSLSQQHRSRQGSRAGRGERGRGGKRQKVKATRTSCIRDLWEQLEEKKWPLDCKEGSIFSSILSALCQRSWYWGPESLITGIFSAVNTNKKTLEANKDIFNKGAFFFSPPPLLWKRGQI